MAGLRDRVLAEGAGFAREVFIVVIGVALGIWAQQLVSEAGWREAVANAKHDITRELRDSGEEALVIVETRECLPAFAARARAVALGEAVGPLPTTAGLFTVDPQEGAWQSAASSQALGHFSHKDLEAYAYAYAMARDLRDATAPLREASAVVRTLNTPRPQRDPVVTQMQLEAVSRLELHHRTLVANAEALVDHLRNDMKIAFSADGVQRAGQERRDCLRLRDQSPATHAPGAEAPR